MKVQKILIEILTALNTVELLRVCSAKLGIGPAQAMHVAERLYTQGIFLNIIYKLAIK